MKFANFIHCDSWKEHFKLGDRNYIGLAFVTVKIVGNRINNFLNTNYAISIIYGVMVNDKALRPLSDVFVH